MTVVVAQLHYKILESTRPFELNRFNYLPNGHTKKAHEQMFIFTRWKVHLRKFCQEIFSSCAICLVTKLKWTHAIQTQTEMRTKRRANKRASERSERSEWTSDNISEHLALYLFCQVASLNIMMLSISTNNEFLLVIPSKRTFWR